MFKSLTRRLTTLFKNSSKRFNESVCSGFMCSSRFCSCFRITKRIYFLDPVTLFFVCLKLCNIGGPSLNRLFQSPYKLITLARVTASPEYFMLVHSVHHHNSPFRHIFRRNILSIRYMFFNLVFFHNCLTVQWAIDWGEVRHPNASVISIIISIMLSSGDLRLTLVSAL